MVEKESLEYYDFHEMSKEVDKALGYRQRESGEHFYPDATSFYDWYKTTGYPEIDSDGKSVGSSQIWYAEYQVKIKSGELKEVPYCDFWHWQLDNVFMGDITNGCYINLSVSLDGWDNIEPWQLEIQWKWNELFGHLADGDGWIFVCVGW